MKRFIVALIYLSFASVALASRIDTTFVTSDSVSLAMSYYVPSTPMPAHGYPAILCVHGFGGSKADYDGIAAYYAAYGYFVVAYTVRGQGVSAAAGNQSGGLFNWWTGDRELADAREVLDWMRNNRNVDSMHVGMEGISQGGLTTWGAAINHFPLQCCAPIIAVPNYAEMTTAHGCINYTFAYLTYAAKQFGSVNLGPYIPDSVNAAIASDQFDTLRARMINRDLGAQIKNISAPMYLQCAWFDQIFGSQNIFDAYDSIRSPKKLLIWSGPHGLPGTVPAAVRGSQIMRFYDRYLRDDTAEHVMNPDSAVTLFDVTNQSVAILSDSLFHMNLASSAEPINYFLTLGGELTRSAPRTPMTISSVYVQNFSNDLSNVFTSPPFDSDVTVFHIGAELIVNSTGLRYQANALLWDVDDTGNAVAVTRGFYEVRDTQTGWRTIDYDLNPVLHTFRAGHKLRVLIKFGSPSILPSDEFGQSPYPPQESVTDSLRSGPEGYSMITLRRFIPPIGSVDSNSSVSLTNHPTSDDMSMIVFSGEPIRYGGSSGELYNDLGIVVAHEVQRTFIETTSLPIGMYFLRYTDLTNQLRIQKIIIRRDH